VPFREEIVAGKALADDAITVVSIERPLAHGRAGPVQLTLPRPFDHAPA
jgi:hypothetical protein